MPMKGVPSGALVAPRIHSDRPAGGICRDPRTWVRRIPVEIQINALVFAWIGVGIKLGYNI